MGGRARACSKCSQRWRSSPGRSKRGIGCHNKCARAKPDDRKVLWRPQRSPLRPPHSGKWRPHNRQAVDECPPWSPIRRRRAQIETRQIQGRAALAESAPGRGRQRPSRPTAVPWRTRGEAEKCPQHQSLVAAIRRVTAAGRRPWKRERRTARSSGPFPYGAERSGPIKARWVGTFLKISPKAPVGCRAPGPTTPLRPKGYARLRKLKSAPSARTSTC